MQPFYDNHKATMNATVCIDLTESDDEDDRKPAARETATTTALPSSDASWGPRARTVSAEHSEEDFSANDDDGDDDCVIDLTISDDDDDDDDSRRFGKSRQAEVARKRKRNNQAHSREANSYSRNLNPFQAHKSNHHSRDSKKRQEREDEAFARSLQLQENAGKRPQQHLHNTTATASNIFRTETPALLAINKHTTDFEVVARVCKDIERKLKQLGWDSKVSLGQKVDRLPLPVSARAEAKQLLSWRNRIIHEHGADSFVAVGTSRDEFVETYFRLLKVLADFPSDSVLRPSATNKIRRKKPRS